jgi:hypothetical protein
MVVTGIKLHSFAFPVRGNSALSEVLGTDGWYRYNAAIFTALTTSTYSYAIVTEASLTVSSNASVPSTSSQNVSFYEIPKDIMQMYYDVQENFTLFETLNSSYCWEEYYQQVPFLITPRSVLLVSSNNSNYSLLDWETWGVELVLLDLKERGIPLPARLWTGATKYAGPRLNATTADGYWKEHGNQIQYCLRRSDTSQLIDERTCYLESSFHIMLGKMNLNIPRTLAEP